MAKEAGMPRDQVELFLAAGYLPQPKQARFHAACRSCDDGPQEVGFGGARGPGKSHALVAQIALDDCQRCPGLKALLLRKVGKAVRESFEDLRLKVLKHVPHDYNRSSGVVKFPNGSRIVLGHFQNDNDIDNYLGLEYDTIGAEEATALSYAKYKAVRTCNRSSGYWRPRAYNSTNPGGIGHAWYKRRFVIPHRNGTETETRFIPATVYDNAYVNKEYVLTLEDLTGWRRAAWLDGSWDIAAGQFFTNFDAKVHTIPAQGAPMFWPYYWLALDYGWTHPTAAVLLAMDNSDKIYVIDEYREARLPVAEHVNNLRQLLAYWGVNNLYTVIAGGDMWLPGRDGTTVASEYEAAFPLERANMNRIDGASSILQRLNDGTLFIYDHCHHLIETLSMLQHDEHRPEDVKKVDVDDSGEGGDDLYDALRYGVLKAGEFKTQAAKIEVLHY